MKYYTLKYTDNIKDGFGGLASMWRIKILNKYKNDVGLLEHEKFHVRCWWYCLAATWIVALVIYFVGAHGWWSPVFVVGPWMHGMLYRNKYFRKMVEVRAYKIQIKKGGYSDVSFAVRALTDKYNLGISESHAKNLLGLP